jgi:predicted  nucleic acid-binding Zn-ribbon protein
MVQKATAKKPAKKAPAKKAGAKKRTTAKKSAAPSLKAKDALYAVLGIQKAAYDLGVEKYNELNAKRKETLDFDFGSYVKRGEEVESLLQGKFEEFKGQDNFVAKQVVKAEEQAKKVADKANELNGKVSELNEKFSTAAKKVQEKVQSKFQKQAA